MLVSKFDLSQRGASVEEEIERVEEEEITSTVVAGEEKDRVPDRILNRSEISVRLSWIGKTAQGDGYTYIKVDLRGMELTSIRSIASFKQLQFVDISNNYLKLEEIQVVTKLPYLCFIQMDNNKIKTPNLHKCKYLQVIIANKCGITTLEHVFQPQLTTFEAAHNNIYEIDFTNRMSTLTVLDLANNYIRGLGAIVDKFANLDSLFLGGNKIKSLEGIAKLQNLRTLHLRNNPIRWLTGLEEKMPKLETLNLRCCKIGTLRQVKKLRAQTNLEVLILANTPYMEGTGKEEDPVPEDDPDTRVSVLTALGFLKRLNKKAFTEEEREEAKDLKKLWDEEGEKEEEEEVEEIEALEEELPGEAYESQHEETDDEEN